MNKSNFASYQPEKPQNFFFFNSFQDRKKFTRPNKKKMVCKWRFPVFWCMLKYVDFCFRTTSEWEKKREQNKIWPEFGWHVCVCVCVPLMIRSLTSHTLCNRQSLLEANGVAQLQNVAACDSIMLKMRVLLFAADNAAESVF